ncbi:MAG: hypothetical protein LBK60_00405 [Verrucomicrobiales bacterium]|jgi:myosin-crossreactive antigen|nr:hypothetical protein [Verrucomicrobiales bacterium]
MKTRKILRDIVKLISTVSVGEHEVFDTVEIFDADNPNEQAARFAEKDGRFCLDSVVTRPVNYLCIGDRG